MNKNLWVIASVVLGLVLLTAVVLVNRDSIQTLGKPGVKVVAEPTYNNLGEVVSDRSVFLPPDILSYTSSNMPISDVVLGWLPGDTTYGQRLYQGTNGFFLQVNVVLMGTDRTSIHKPQFCLTGQGWNIKSTEYTTIPMTEPHAYDLPVIRMDGEQLVRMTDNREVQMSAVYVYWFVADGVVTSEHNTRMVGILKDLPSGVLQRWAYVSAFAVAMPGYEDMAFDTMKEFIQEAVPEFQLAAGPEKVAATESTTTEP